MSKYPRVIDYLNLLSNESLLSKMEEWVNTECMLLLNN